MVFPEAPLTLTGEGDVLRLRACLLGAPVDRHAEQLRNDVNGVTKPLYEVKESEGHWTAIVVLDV